MTKWWLNLGIIVTAVTCSRIAAAPNLIKSDLEGGHIQSSMRIKNVIQKTITENELLTFVHELNWFENTAMEIVPQMLPSGASMNYSSGTVHIESPFSWIPTYCQSGFYEIYVVNVITGVDTWFDIYQVTVNNVNRLPVFTTAPPEVKQSTVGANWQEAITSTDLDMTECGDDALSMTYAPVPPASGMLLEDKGNGNAVFHWTPTENEVGTYTITFEAHDQYGGICSAQVAVEVTEASCCVGRVGDANGEGEYPDEVTLGDIMLLVDVKFISGDCSKLACLPEADVNQDGGTDPTCEDHVTLGDIMTLVDFLFITGPENTTLPECL